jgi:hypothetical protein
MSTLIGTTGNDTLFGSTAISTYVRGVEGDDRLVSQVSLSTLAGGEGDDLLEIQQGDGSTIVMLPGKGDDTISISGISTLVDLRIARGLGTSFNLGDDVFAFDGVAAEGAFVRGTMKGGDGDDTVRIGGGTDLNGAIITTNVGDDFVSISGTTALNFVNSRIGLGKGADSAVVSIDSADLLLNGLTINGGEGADTLNILANTGVYASGNNIFSMGGGADKLSATLAFNSGFISGSLNLIGNSGKDTIELAVNGATNGNFELNVYGDGTAVDATAGNNDLIDYNWLSSAFTATTGIIAGGAGDDLISFSAAGSTAGSAAIEINGGFGADTINLVSNTYAGTVDGGAGDDLIDVGLGSGVAAIFMQGTVNGLGFGTLIGGAGDDTFQNTSFGTGVAVANTGTYSTALIVSVADMVTGDIFKLLGQKVVNAAANVNASAFLTESFTAFTGLSGNVTGESNNNIALFRVGDDVVLQILVGSNAVTALSAATATGQGIAVIRFKGNSAFGTSVDGASGALSNLDFAYNQSLNGASFNFT